MTRTVPTEFQVGSIVRIPRGEKWTGKAIISTIDENDQVNLCWEDVAPQPVQPMACFVVTPPIPISPDDVDVTVSKSLLQHLLPFERSISLDDDDPCVWKERGDTLLKLGDASSAIPFYERALHLTSRVQIGSTVLIKVKDTVVTAEVDCLEEQTADVTYVASAEEAVVNLKDIGFSISLKDSDLQIRVLLNLARCLLQLAGFDNSPLSRPSLYREGATLACSFAYVMLLSNDNEQGSSSLASLLTSTLLLRSKAHAGRAKWHLSLSDVDQLLQLKPQSKEGRIWRKELMGLIAQSERANKKLVKSMCQWIQSTTNEESVVSEEISESITLDNTKRTDSRSWSRDWVTTVLVLLLSLWVYQTKLS
jgi:hypothetical protein